MKPHKPHTGYTAVYRTPQPGGSRVRPRRSLPYPDVTRNAAPGPGPSAVVTAAVLRTTRRAARRDFPQVERLFRRQVHRQLVQQTHELTYVRGSRDLALRGEPAFQLNATGAAGGRSTQEVAQAVRTQADFSRHTSQRELGRLPRQAVPKQRD